MLLPDTDLDEREPLRCGHPYVNQPRCGLCDRCWECCNCEQKRNERREHQAKQERLIEAKRLQTIRETGKAHVENVGKHSRITCQCGTERTVANWAWAGSGYVRCKTCDAKITRLDRRIELPDAASQ